jgi:L-lactate dehydrogenase complex protein LldE
MDQTCCGQPLANSGFERYTKDGMNHFMKIFKNYDVIVSPSGSCVLFVKEQQEFRNTPDQKIMELSQFLMEYNLADQITATYPKKVGVLQSCHGLRGLQLGKSSELMEEGEPMITQLLSKVKDIELVELDRQDDCCGFGGTFSVKESTLSVKMGNDT